MCSLFKSVEQILTSCSNERYINLALANHENYWAHTPNAHNISHESLSEHIELVQNYLVKLVLSHGLDKVVDNIIENYLVEKELFSIELGDYIKELFVKVIIYHDHGKINENFQAIKMSNPLFTKKCYVNNGIDSQHSTLSAFVFLNHQLTEISNNLNGLHANCAIVVAFILSYSIYQHHSYHLKNDYKQKIIKETKRTDELKDYLRLFKNSTTNSQVLQLLDNVELLFQNQLFNRFEDSFALYQLSRLSFSLLTATDYLATHQFSNKSAIDDFGIIRPSRIDELYERVTQNEWLNESLGKRNFNKNTYDFIEILDLNEKPIEKSGKWLNYLRQQMATEAVRNLRSNYAKKMFYLEAPTGGGKTNISMLLSLELLRTNEKLNKVYYVFPFTTLIDQTFDSLKDGLGLLDSEIVALHSRSSFGVSSNNDEVDANYGINQRDYIDRLFGNYPFTLLSHVKFFEILKTNIKERNYMLHRLANSVVIIDEIQSYNPRHWDKIMFFIKKYAELYNMRFILMSATLPKISNLKIDKYESDDFVYLLPSAKRSYFNNVNFSGRVIFDYSLSNGRISLQELAQKVIEESKLYSEVEGGISKPRNSVYTVVEFIFKKATTIFEREINKINNGFFDDIFVLSGTILSHRRKYIINRLKSDESRLRKVLLITTQVVEAGVDIDMDLGFKDASLLDSDEQLAGRINRNVNKKDCKLFLFNYSNESFIYGKDLRYELTKELNQEEKEHVLNNKDFDYLYQRVIDYKNIQNHDHNFVGVDDYISKINNLQYESVSNEFKLIEQDNFSCFIPMSIPVLIEGNTSSEFEEVFNANELNFLSDNGIFPDADNLISGELVFDIYMKLVKSETSPFKRKIAIKQLHSILSKYTFSLFASAKTKERLIEFMDLDKSEFGYFYMSRWEEFYSEHSGIDESAFDNIENQFI